MKNKPDEEKELIRRASYHLERQLISYPYIISINYRIIWNASVTWLKSYHMT